MKEVVCRDEVMGGEEEAAGAADGIGYELAEAVCKTPIRTLNFGTDPFPISAPTDCIPEHLSRRTSVFPRIASSRSPIELPGHQLVF
jgi:hypothetical protein